MNNPLAEKLIKLLGKLQSDRSNWESHWKEVAEYVVPNKDNVYGNDSAKGEKKFQELYDGTAVHSNELLGSALHGMLSNPTNPFFGLSSGDLELDKNDAVRKWLQDCTRTMHDVLNNSNFQTEIHEVYLDLGSFGTGALFIDEDDVDIVRFQAHTIYSVWIAENYKGVVDTVIRKFKKPLKDIRKEFGDEWVKQLPTFNIESDQNKEYEIIHAVYPNDSFNPNDTDKTKKPFVSCYILANEKVTLREKGYDTYPWAIPRWTKISGESYGRSPAMKCLPDTKMINTMMKVTIRSAQKIVDPPLMAPDDGIMGGVKTAPGAINYYRAGSSDRIEPLETGGRIDFGFQIMEDVRTRIRSAFFIDQLQLREGPQMTATEVMQRTEEQLRLLGPILGRQHNELLAPLITRVFDICMKRNMFKEMPAQLKNIRNLVVQYSSMIARAQKTAELDSFNRFFQMGAPIFQADPKTLHLLNGDNGLKHIAQSLNLPYEFLRTDNEVKKIRQAEAEASQEAAAQQQQAMQAEMLAKAGPVIEGTKSA
jgi:hypothetical protein